MRHVVALGMVLAAGLACLAVAGEQRPAAIPDLIRQLSSNDPHLRQQAARQLGDRGAAARDAVAALGKLRHDPVAEVRHSATKALGQIGKSAVPVLIERLRDRDADERARTARTLARIGPDAVQAVPELM
jgi:HEAT repeat protein